METLSYCQLMERCIALAAENESIKFYLRNGPVIRKGGELAAAHQFAPETPTTDAFLAEVRAQGAEECVRQLVISDTDDFSDAPNICAMVAHQLRQEAQ